MSTVGTPTLTARGVSRRTRPALWSEIVPVVDQGVSSASNFAVGVLVARVSTTGSFATFTIATTLYVVLQGALRGGLHLQLLALPDESARRCVSGRVVWLSLVVGAALALLATPLSLHADAAASALVCLALPLLLMQDAQRFAAFCLRRDVDALIGDACWLGVMLALVSGWWLAGGALTPTAITAMWIVGAVVGVGVLVVRGYTPRGGARLATVMTPSAVRAGTGEFLVAASVTFGIPLLAAFAFGAAGISVMHASLLFFAVGFALLPGMQTPVLRVLRAASLERRRPTQHLIGIALFLGSSVVVLGMLLARDTLGPLLLGNIWPSTAPVVVPAACFIVARFVELPAYTAIRVQGGSRSLFGVRSATSAVILISFVVAMAAGASLLIAYWVLAVAALGCALGAHVPRWSSR